MFSRNGIRMEIIVMYLMIYMIQFKCDGRKYPFTCSDNASTVSSYWNR